MKILSLFKNNFLAQKPKILLGRWNIIYCENQISKKVDLSNEDHCGICNQYEYGKNDKNEKYYNINKIIFYETM